MSGPRVLFFGMEGLFSRAPLAALLAASCMVCAVIVPRPAAALAGGVSAQLLRPPPRRPRALPLLGGSSEPTVVGLAWQAGISVLDVDRLDAPHTLAALASLHADLICMACFPHLLPRAVLRLPHDGALNVHPSLLPEYRGPSPLFWIFHDDLERAGVTVHLMDARADTGDIVAQARVALRDGTSYGQAERMCSEIGARLLVEVVYALRDGAAHPRPQSSSGATDAPVPRDQDFVITPEWASRRVANFMRGVAEWDRPFILRAGNSQFVVRAASAVSTDEIGGRVVVEQKMCLSGWGIQQRRQG